MSDNKRFRVSKQVITGFGITRLGSGQVSSRIYGSIGFKCEYVVVAGGGAGTDRAGGGGGGGYRSSVVGELTGGGGAAESLLSLSTGTDYLVSIGAGSTTVGYPSANGSDSRFAAITSKGGAGAGIYGNPNVNPAINFPGGSGSGGEGFGTSNSGQVRVTNPIQGNNGGIPATANNAEGDGGGGGAGAQGANAVWNRGGDGGSGQTSSITGAPVVRAGGGGGGGNNTAGGYGNGGAGSGSWGRNDSTPVGTGAPANSGGGGGGAYWGTGGSGIIIIRYPASRTIIPSAGLTTSTVLQGVNKVTQITAGAGTVKFS
jgi:hypothetical protein